MGAFEYVALDASGKERKGLIEGDTPKHVRQLLREKQLLPMEIQEAAEREHKQSRTRRPFMRRGLSTLDLALLTHAGVCQDFAHIMITLVRSKLRIPCRYVSGYLFHGQSDKDRSVTSATTHSMPTIAPLSSDSGE